MCKIWYNKAHENTLWCSAISQKFWHRNLYGQAIDIELMKIELERIYDAGLMDKLEYLEAEAVLRREHQLELKYIEKNGEWKKWPGFW